MWGDYHAMELAVYLQRLLNKKPYLKFYAFQNHREDVAHGTIIEK